MKYPKCYASYELRYYFNKYDEYKNIFILNVLTRDDHGVHYLASVEIKYLDRSILEDKNEAVATAKGFREDYNHSLKLSRCSYEYKHKFFAHECSPKCEYIPTLSEIKSAIEYAEKNPSNDNVKKFYEMYSNKTAKQIREEYLNIIFK